MVRVLMICQNDCCCWMFLKMTPAGEGCLCVSEGHWKGSLGTIISFPPSPSWNTQRRHWAWSSCRIKYHFWVFICTLKAANLWRVYIVFHSPRRPGRRKQAYYFTSRNELGIKKFQICWLNTMNYQGWDFLGSSTGGLMALAGSTWSRTMNPPPWALPAIYLGIC